MRCLPVCPPAPQLLLVDGFGVLHPRRCGSASHLGVLSGLPTGACRPQPAAWRCGQAGGPLLLL